MNLETAEFLDIPFFISLSHEWLEVRMTTDNVVGIDLDASFKEDYLDGVLWHQKWRFIKKSFLNFPGTWWSGYGPENGDY